MHPVFSLVMFQVHVLPTRALPTTRRVQIGNVAEDATPQKIGCGLTGALDFSPISPIAARIRDGPTTSSFGLRLNRDHCNEPSTMINFATILSKTNEIIVNT